MEAAPCKTKAVSVNYQRCKHVYKDSQHPLLTSTRGVGGLGERSIVAIPFRGKNISRSSGIMTGAQASRLHTQATETVALQSRNYEGWVSAKSETYRASAWPSQSGNKLPAELELDRSPPLRSGF